MASIAAIREALAANLSTIPNVQVSAWMLSNATPPTIWVFPGGPGEAIEYDLAHGRGLDKLTFTVQAFVGATTDIGAQKQLDRMLATSGPDSIKEAVESDETLGGLCDALRVTSTTGYRMVRNEGGERLVCEWFVEVYADGN